MSRSIPLEVIKLLESSPNNIRNICILAHVDHGKTTLADGLISSNNIISNRLAGELRYMDNLEQEQKRGITMKSSAITLFYEDQMNYVTYDENHELKEEIKKKPYIINLIDSPGHVDFSSDVAAAVRLCDTAYIIVDVIEGVCNQTISVLQQAWEEGVACIVILNKIDRLFTELKQSPSDIYNHLNNIITQLNAIQSSIYKSYLMRHTDDTYIDINEKEEQQYMYSPIKGNVLFASALQGWCFSLSQFINIVRESCPIDLSTINTNNESSESIKNNNILATSYIPYMWGNYAYNTKKRQFVELSPTSSTPNIFIQYILKPIAMLYKQCYNEPRNVDRIMQMINILHININKKIVQVSESQALIKSIMNQWLPLYKGALSVLCEYFPSSKEAQFNKYKFIFPDYLLNKISITPPSVPVQPSYKRPILMNHQSFSFAPSLPDPIIDIYTNFVQCNNKPESNLLLYIGKTYSVKGCDIFNYTGSRDDDICVYLGRVYSGVITTNMNSLYYIPNDYNPLENKIDTCKKIEDPIKLYIPMGRELVPVDSMPAGNIVVLTGLDKYIHKYGTLCSVKGGIPLTNMKFQCDPIVKVAIEPLNPSEMPQFLKGLDLLKETDMSIRVDKQNTGEYLLYGLGELHLQTCIYNLEQLSKIKVQMSSPLIELKESISYPIESKDAYIKRPIYIYNKNLYIKMSAMSLPESICHYIDKLSKESSIIYKFIIEDKKPTSEIYNFLKGLIELLRQNTYLAPYIYKIIAVGPSGFSNCFLINAIQDINYIFDFTSHWNAYIHKYIDRDCKPTTSGISTSEIQTDNNHMLLQTPSSLCSESDTNDKEINISPYSIPEVIEEEEKEKEEINIDDKKEEIKDKDDTSDDENDNTKDETDSNNEENEENEENDSNDDSTEDESDTSDDESDTSEDETDSSDEESVKEEMNPDWNTDISYSELKLELLHIYDKAICYGWESSITNGPLLSEPLWGTVFFLEDIFICKESINKYTSLYDTKISNQNESTPQEETDSDDDDAKEYSKNETQIIESYDSIQFIQNEYRKKIFKKYIYYRFITKYPLGLMLLSFQNHFRNLIRKCGMRLVEPMYKCVLQCNTNQLGKLYTVIGKRHGRIIDEDLWEGTDIFTIACILPELDSIGIADDLRKETSGSVNHPQLFFDSWCLYNEDPYYKPTTKEEIEEWGDSINTKNRARKIVESIRERKGLDNNEYIVFKEEE